jgi:hypothetical protein
MVKRIVTMMFAVLVMAFCISGQAFAQPGPTVVTLMERAEWNSDVMYNNEYKDTVFAYTLLSASRELDKGVFGNVYYMNKYDVTNSGVASNMGGVGLTQTLTKKTSMTYSYSYNSNPARELISPQERTNDRFSFAFNYALNPKEKVKPRYSLKTTYGTGTNFRDGETISEKLTIENKLRGNWSYAGSYQLVWGLSKGYESLGVYSEQYGNQFEFDLNCKLDKTTRFNLGVLYLNNLYNGATTDNTIIRMGIMKSFSR